MLPNKFPKNDKEADAIIRPIRKITNEELKKFLAVNGVHTQEQLLEYNKFVQDNADKSIELLKNRINQMKDRGKK